MHLEKVLPKAQREQWESVGRRGGAVPGAGLWLPPAIGPALPQALLLQKGHRDRDHAQQDGL